MRRFAVALAVIAGGVSGCSSSPPPGPSVAMQGTKSSLSQLVGRWEGEYSSVQTGRSGSIVFEFKSGSATGHGDVLMWPKGSKTPISPSASGQLTEEQLRTMPQMLAISFVEATGGYLTGTMDPYIDPDCQCEVRTTFAGSIDGDFIVGQFSIERWDKKGTPAKGTFKAQRKKT